MIGGGEEAPAAAGSSQPLEWKFAQVFSERTVGEEVQEVFKNTRQEFWIELIGWGQQKETHCAKLNNLIPNECI
ncbi:serine/threonine protein phosphatase 2A 55 kDa regulatory subunit B alpha isoform-like isoform X2 [Fagus crenata]